jgi:putative DNA primase/helicase
VADHDKAGLEAARALARRLLREGRKVRLAVPPVEGEDWLDALNASGLRKWATSSKGPPRWRPPRKGASRRRKEAPNPCPRAWRGPWPAGPA